MVQTNVLNDLNPVFSTSLTSVPALASQHLSRFSGCKFAVIYWLNRTLFRYLDSFENNNKCV